VCIYLNYIFIKLFVEHFHFYPTVSKIFTTIIVVSFSYFTQKHFTFKAGSGVSEG
jgi:putative flippase GtrA